MVGWHHRLDGHEFEQAPGDGEGQGSGGCKELDTTQRLNNKPSKSLCAPEKSLPVSRKILYIHKKFQLAINNGNINNTALDQGIFKISFAAL